MLKNTKSCRKFRHKLKAECVESLGGVCVVCGTTENLQFDHVDPDTKMFNISRGIRDFGDSPILWAEVTKCQLLCLPHHKEKTRREAPKAFVHGTNAMYEKHKCRCDLCREWKSQKNQRLWKKK